VNWAFIQSNSLNFYLYPDFSIVTPGDPCYPTG
jgi:hypothetical protein